MIFETLSSVVDGAIEMIHDIPEEIIKNARLCRHSHGCLSSHAIFPQCRAMGEKRGDAIVVKKKPYCLGECLYHSDTAGQGIDKLSFCYCPVFVETFKRDEN